MSFIHFLTHRFLPSVLALSLVVGLLPTQSAFADVNKLYVTPDNSQMNVGTSFVVNVRSYGTGSTGSVKGTLLYTTSSLKVTAISVGGSDYGSPTITQENGKISFSGKRTSTAGTAQIFAVTFLATTPNNEATVGFSGDSKLNNATTTYNVGRYVITNPPPATPKPSPSASASPSTKPSTRPSGGSSSGGSGSSSNTNNNTSGTNYSRTPVYTEVPVDTTPIVTADETTVQDPGPLAVADPTGTIESVVASPTYTSATVTWKVAAANPTATFAYGPSTSTLDQTATVDSKGDGNFSATISNLTPGQKYYFTITSTGTGVSAGTYSSSIQTTGFPVIVNVTENKVLANAAQVQIGANNYTTHADGKVTVALAAGSYSGKITTETATLSINLTVAKKDIPADGSQPEAQSVSFDLTSTIMDNGPGTSSSVFTFIGILVGGAVILVIGFLIFINYRRRKFDSSSDSVSYNSYAGPSVMIQDGYNWQQDSDGQNIPEQPASSYVAGASGSYGSSVYLDEQEPLDMFEQDKLAHQGQATTPIAETEQNSSQPHSTTP